MTLFMCKPAKTPLRTKASQAAVGLLAAAGLWGAAAAVQAGDPPPANQGQTPAQTQVTASKPVKPKMICRDEEEIGTRLGGRRVCHTQEEWNQIVASEAAVDMNATGSQAVPKMPGSPK